MAVVVGDGSGEGFGGLEKVEGVVSELAGSFGPDGLHGALH